MNALKLLGRSNVTCFLSTTKSSPPPTRIRRRFYGSKFEPPYLDEITHDPRYDTILLRLQGHDFPILEKFESLSRNYAKRFSIPVGDCYPIPTRQTKMMTFDPEDNGKEGAKVIEEFILETFERVVTLKEVDASALCLFFEFLRNHQPEGVSLSAGKPDPELEKFRYIPDMEMDALVKKLKEVEDGKLDT